MLQFLLQQAYQVFSGRYNFGIPFHQEGEYGVFLVQILADILPQRVGLHPIYYSRRFLLVECPDSIHRLILRCCLMDFFYHCLERIKILAHFVHVALIGIAEYILAVVIQIIGHWSTGTTDTFLDQKLLCRFFVNASVFKPQEASGFVDDNQKAYFLQFHPRRGQILTPMVIII